MSSQDWTMLKLGMNWHRRSGGWSRHWLLWDPRRLKDRTRPLRGFILSGIFKPVQSSMSSMERRPRLPLRCLSTMRHAIATPNSAGQRPYQCAQRETQFSSFYCVIEMHNASPYRSARNTATPYFLAGNARRKRRSYMLVQYIKRYIW